MARLITYGTEVPRLSNYTTAGLHPTAPILPTAPTVGPRIYPVKPWKAPYVPKEPKDYFVADPSNPLEQNSVADIIFNSIRKQKNNPNTVEAQNIAMFDMIKDSAKLLYQGTIKPLFKGDGNAAFMNTLVNVGETLDIPANMAKGIVLGGTKGFMNSIGMGESETRQAYNIDTGNVALDIATEFLIDPMNWATLGVTGFAKLGSKNLAKSMGSTLAKEGIEGLTEQGVKKIAKDSINQYLRGNYDDMTTSLNAMLGKWSKDTGKHVMNKTLTTPEAKKAMDALLQAGMEVKSSNVLASVKALVKPLGAADDALTSFALNASGIAPVWNYGLKPLGSWGAKATRALTHTSFKPYAKASGESLNIFKYGDIKETYAHRQRVASLTSLYKNADNTPMNTLEALVRNTLDIDATQVNKLYAEFGDDVRKFNEALNKHFELSPGTNALDVYVNQLKMVNADANGLFDDLVAEFEGLKSEIADRAKNALDIANYKNYNAAFGSIEEVYNNALKILDDGPTSLGNASLNSRLTDLLEDFYDPTTGVMHPGYREAAEKLIRETEMNFNTNFAAINGRGLGIDQYNEYVNSISEMLGEAFNRVMNTVDFDIPRSFDDYANDILYDLIPNLKQMTEDMVLKLQGLKPVDPVISSRYSAKFLGTGKIAPGTTRFINVMKDPNVVNNLLKQGENYSNMLRRNLDIDNANLRDIFDIYKDNITKMDTALNTYFQTSTKNPLDVYISKLTELNRASSGEFEDLLAKALEYKEVRDELAETTRAKLRLESFHKLDEMADRFIPDITTKAKEFFEDKKFFNNIDKQVKKANSTEQLISIYSNMLESLDEITNFYKLSFTPYVEDLKGIGYHRFLNEEVPAMVVDRIALIKESIDQLVTGKLALKEAKDMMLKQGWKKSFNSLTNGGHALNELLLEISRSVEGDRVLRGKIVNEGTPAQVSTFYKGIEDIVKRIQKQAGADLKFVDANGIPNNMGTKLEALKKNVYKVIEKITKVDADSTLLESFYDKLSTTGLANTISKARFTLNIEEFLEATTVEDYLTVMPRLQYTIDTILKTMEFKKAKAVPNILKTAKDGTQTVVKGTMAASGEHLADIALSAEEQALVYVLKELQEINIYDSVHAMITLEAGTKLSHMKQEQVYTLMSLMSDETVYEFLSAVRANSGAGAFVSTLAKGNYALDDPLHQASLIAKRIDEYAAHYVNTKGFLDRVDHAAVEGPFKEAFISTIQKYARFDPEALLLNFDYHFENIIKSTQDYNYYKNMDVPLNMDSFRNNNEKIMEYVSKFKKADELQAHEGMYDLFTNEAVIKTFGLEKEFSDPGKRYVMFDIETLNTSVFEIAVKEYNAEDGVTLARKLDKSLSADQPDSNLLRVFGMDEEEFFKKRSGSATNQRELLENFIAQLRSFGPSENIVLVGHNIEEFDIPKILQFMKDEGIPFADIAYFENLAKKDTLKLLQAKNGFKPMPTDQISKLKRILRSFVETQDNLGASKLMQPVERPLIDSLNELGSTLFALNDGGLKGLTPELSEAMLKGQLSGSVDVARDLANIYKSTAKLMTDTLRSISQTNKQLGQVMMVPGLFKEGTELNKTLIEEYNKLLAKIGIDKKVSYLNSSKMLYPFGEEVAKPYATRNMADVNSILNWFPFEDGAKIDSRLAQKLSKAGTGMNKLKENVRRVEVLDDYAEDLKEALSLFASPSIEDIFTSNVPMPVVVEGVFLPKFFNYLKLDYGDNLSNYAAVQYAYNKMKFMVGAAEARPTERIHLYWAELQRRLPEGLQKELLDKPDTLKFTKQSLEVDPRVASPRELQRIAKDFQDAVTNPLMDLGEALDMAEGATAGQFLYRAKTQIYSAMLDGTQKMLDAYANVLSVGGNAKKVFLENMRSYTDDLAVQQTVQQLTLRGQDLVSFMLDEAPWMEFSISDLSKNPSLKTALADLMADPKGLKELGIQIEEAGDRVYVVLTKEAYEGVSHSYDTATKSVKWINRKGDTFEYTKPQMLDIASNKLGEEGVISEMIKVREQMQTLTEGKLGGSLGEHMNLDNFKQLYLSLPDSVRKLLPDEKVLTDEALWKRHRFNNINLGTLASRHKVNPYTSYDAVNIYRKASERVVKKAKESILYTQYYFRPEFAMNNSAFFTEAADSEIIEALNGSREYIVSALVQDKKLGHKAVKLNIKTAEDLAEARKLNAIIVPRHTYQTLASAINEGLVSDIRGSAITKLNYITKVGYLVSTGGFARNWVDSTWKTMATTRTGLLGALQAQARGAKIAGEFDDVVKRIMELNNFNLRAIEDAGLSKFMDVTKTFEDNKTSLMGAIADMKHSDIADKIMKMDPQQRYSLANEEFYFKHLKTPGEMDYKTYKNIDSLIKDGLAIGETKQLKNLHQKYIDDIIKKDGKFTDHAWNKFLKASDWMLTPNNKIEQWVRLGHYLLEIEKGSSNTKAYHNIIRTHFDYSDKSRTELLMEMVIPFYSYTMKNFEYWLDMLESDPAVFRQIENFLTPALDMDEYSKEEMQANLSLQYQVTSGAIPIYSVPGADFTIKLSPSVMDAIQLALNPVDTLSGKVSSPIQSAGQSFMNMFRDEESQQEGLGIKDIPIVGSMYQRYVDTGQRNFGRTGNILNAIVPTLFGATKRWEEREPYQRRTFSKLKQPRSSGTRRAYARKPRRAFARKSYKPKRNFGKRFYGKKTYANKIYAKNVYADRTYAQRQYATATYNSWVYPNSRSKINIYQKQYTKKGKSRLKQVMMPTTPQKLRYQIINFNQLYR